MSVSLSPRYAIPVMLLLGATLVPVALRRFEPRFVDGCARPEALKATSLIDGSIAWGERLEQRSDSVIQWSEGEIPTELGSRRRKASLEFQLIRSFDARRFYERPISLARGKIEPEVHELRWLEGPDGRIPVHVVTDRTSSESRVVSYLFAYDNEAVASPFLAQLRDALGELAFGSRPLTLFLVDARGPRGATEELADESSAWLSRAWGYFDATCRG